MFDADGGSAATLGAAAGAAIGQSMMNFASAAASGAFAVNQTGGQALLSAIRNMKDGIDQIQSDVQASNWQVPLGGSHGAKTMAKFDTEVVQDDQGFMPTLLKFRESLEAAEQGINDAMRNYQAMDERGASGLRSV
jgi:hypothetical protein